MQIDRCRMVDGDAIDVLIGRTCSYVWDDRSYVLKKTHALITVIKLVNHNYNIYKP